MKKRVATLTTAVTMALAVLVTQLFTGCNASNTTKGGAIGAGAGGAIGGIIGSRSDNTAVGAIIGAAVGGAAGALIGRQMDKQAEELKKDLQGAKVERVGEGILITFGSGLLFDLNSAQLKAETKKNLTDLSATLNKYDDTNLLIEGHTDSSGETDHNMKLSDQRAASVEGYLITQGVAGSRITTEGYGESQPKVSNDSENGRQENRRVEVAIYANKKMKRLAEKGELGE